MQRLAKATQYSIAGFREAWRRQASIRLELSLLVPVVALAMWVAESPLRFALLTGAYLLVILTEMVNSAIETTVDRISYEHHELSGVAKDMGSAAVAIASLIASVIWLAVIWERWL